MAGLTGMLVQLCMAEELTYITLRGKCNSLNAEAFSCHPLLAGLAARPVTAKTSFTSQCNGRITTKLPCRRRKSISCTAYLEAVRIISYPSTKIRFILFCTEARHTDLCLRFSLSQILSFVYRSK